MGECLFPCRHAMELWEMLGSSGLGVQILQHLTQQLEAAGENESVGALGSAEVCLMAEGNVQLCVC